MLEVALYLQDNSEEYGGGLDVIPGSHFLPDKYVKPRLPAKGALGRFWRNVKYKLARYGLQVKEKTPVGRYLIPSKAGDLVLFNFKIDHKSTAANGPIPPERRKFAMFFACSANNRHVENYIQFLLSRPDYHYLKNHRYPESLQELADENNVILGKAEEKETSKRSR